MAYALPTIDRDALNVAIDAMHYPAEVRDEFKAIAALLFKVRGNKNQLRASKPKVDDKKPLTGKAAYVWRMVAFIVSPNPQHHCMPMTADFDLPAFSDVNGRWSCAIARPMAKELKPLEDVIIDMVPKNQWVGALRWARVLS